MSNEFGPEAQTHQEYLQMELEKETSALLTPEVLGRITPAINKELQKAALEDIDTALDVMTKLDYVTRQHPRDLVNAKAAAEQKYNTAISRYRKLGGE